MITPKDVKDNIIWNIIKVSKYLIYLVLGYIIGEVISIDITKFIDAIVFCNIIGILLRLEKILLKDIFKNKIALIISTSITSALIISLFIGISIKQGIMICSGLGWYSLSVVLNTNFLGEYYGMVTFMIDFLRQIFVIVLISIT